MLTGVVSIPISAISSYAEFTQLALDGDMNSLYVLEDATSNTIIFAQMVDGVVKLRKVYKNAQNGIANETNTTSNTSTSTQTKMNLQYFAEETKYTAGENLAEHLGKGSINQNGHVSGAHTFEAFSKLNPDVAYNPSLYKEFATNGHVFRKYRYTGKNGTVYTKTVCMDMTASEMIVYATEAVNNSSLCTISEVNGEFFSVDSCGLKWTGFIDIAKNTILSCWPDF